VVQEQLYRQLLDSGFLTADERDVLRWGRNATGALVTSSVMLMAPLHAASSL
jgi:hypothetical protein